MTKEEAINILETNAINATGTLGSLPPTAAEKKQSESADRSTRYGYSRTGKRKDLQKHPI